MIKEKDMLHKLLHVIKAKTLGGCYIAKNIISITIRYLVCLFLVVERAQRGTRGL